MGSKIKLFFKRALFFCWIADENEIVQDKEEQSYGSLMMERLTGNTGRIDYVLQVGSFTHTSSRWFTHLYAPLSIYPAN